MPCGPCGNGSKCTGTPRRRPVVADCVLQAVGVGLIALGLTWRVPISVRSETAALRMGLTRYLLKAGVRLGMAGTFRGAASAASVEGCPGDVRMSAMESFAGGAARAPPHGSRQAREEWTTARCTIPSRVPPKGTGAF
jgi:hypothetical protein